ncbi:MAG: hypothetical protein ABSC94_30860 [Polyangiaceae bacterium]|jgi:hypothetical protein
MATARAPFSPQTVFDYDRTVVAFHGTRKATAAKLIEGEPFGPSTNDDDWLGHGIYFWEYAPQRAWEWARQRYDEDSAAVVGALVRLGRCLDLLDPSNAQLLRASQSDLAESLEREGEKLPRNVLSNKYLDCAVFNWLYEGLAEQGYQVETSRAVFVPLKKGGLPRMWSHSGVFEGAHIQLCLREPRNILAVWSVRKDGRYGKDAP